MLILYLGVQLALPVLLIAWIALAPPRSLAGFWVQALATGIGLLALARSGVWLLPPWWSPYAYGALGALAVAVGLARG